MYSAVVASVSRQRQQNAASSPYGSPTQTMAAMSSPANSPGSGYSPRSIMTAGSGAGGGGGSAGLLSAEEHKARINKAQQQQQQLNSMQWTNLTKFPYQRDIGRIADQLKLSKRFANLQDRVIYFRPCVRRRCPNGIMTERVVFVTPNGMVYLCDNDAAPKRTLALSELLSIVTDSVSQIALITDWPLVLRFDQPPLNTKETVNLPGLKTLLMIAHFFKPEAALLRSTPEDFSAINLNLAKPRQFRAPGSFDVLAPPADGAGGATASSSGHHRLDHHADDGTSLATAAGAMMSLAGSGLSGLLGGGSPHLSSGRRGVIVEDKPPILAPYMPGENPASLSPQLNAIIKSQATMMAPGTPTRGGGGGGGSPMRQQHLSAAETTLRRPDPPTGPTDFHAIQQNALFDLYTKRDADAAARIAGDGLERKRDIKSDKASDALTLKMDERDKAEKKRREARGESGADSPVGGGGGKGGKGPSSPDQMTAAMIRLRQQQQQQQQQQQHAARSIDPTASNAPMFYERQQQQMTPNYHYYAQEMPPALQMPAPAASSSASLERSVSFAPRYDKPKSAVYDAAFGESIRSDIADSEGSAEYEIINDKLFFAQLPERFAGKVVDEVRGAVDVVALLEQANEDLRREVLQLRLRERQLTAAPIAMGRVVPVPAALRGAAVRNLGVLVTAICRRRKLLNNLHMYSTAQQNLMHDESRDIMDRQNEQQQQQQQSKEAPKGTARPAANSPVSPPPPAPPSPARVIPPNVVPIRFDDI